MYINMTFSSACEILQELYNTMGIKYDDVIASCLLAGIYLDTNKFYNINNYKTFINISKLIKHGANLKAVQKLFVGSFDNDRKVQDLVNKKEDISSNIALCVADSDKQYTRSDIAKAANYLIPFNYEAVFVIGYIDNNTISISSRSDGNINVCNIMSEFNGGGTITSAAAKVENTNLEEIRSKLINLLKDDEVKKYERKYK